MSPVIHDLTALSAQLCNRTDARRFVFQECETLKAAGDKVAEMVIRTSSPFQIEIVVPWTCTLGAMWQRTEVYIVWVGKIWVLHNLKNYVNNLTF